MSSWTKITFVGGGTGGHLYPAIAVAEALRELQPETRIEFLCSGRSLDASVLRESGYDFRVLPIKGLGQGLQRWVVMAMELISSYFTCIAHFNRRRPKLVFSSGGWLSVAPVVAAATMRIPIALFNPDARLGRANRWLSAFSRTIFVQWLETLDFAPQKFRGRMKAAGCPVRRSFLQAQRDTGLQTWDLDATKKTLLVTGASQGSRNVNRAVLSFAKEVEAAGWQIVHLSGASEYDAVRSAYAALGVKACTLDYVHDMASVMAVADLVVSRAGASTLAELTAVGLPAVLVPYPFDSSHHQLENAKILASRGAAVIVEERKLGSGTAEALRAVVLGLLDSPTELEAMRSSAVALGRRESARSIAMELSALSACAGKKKARDAIKQRTRLRRCED